MALLIFQVLRIIILMVLIKGFIEIINLYGQTKNKVQMCTALILAIIIMVYINTLILITL